MVVILLNASALSREVRDVVVNGGFEYGLANDGTRPRYWYIGFAGDPSMQSQGMWSLDSTVAGQGLVSLRLVPQTTTVESYFVSQFLDAPTFDLMGKTVTLSAKVRVDEAAAGYCLLLAFNPESSDSFGQIPVVGWAGVSPETADTGFVEVSDDFVATGPASALVVLLAAERWGSGAWFDDVRVVFDVAESGSGPDTSDVEDPLGGAERNFYLGTASEIARNQSEAAWDDLPDEISEIGDMINVFAHIKWNGLTDTPLLNGHEPQTGIAHDARGLGLARMLTFDFTHDDPETVGEINPLPDGTPVEALTPEVRSAYTAELLALVDAMEPIIVSVGIETSLLYAVRPDQWDNYVLLLEEVADALCSHSPMHITTYFILDQMIDDEGIFDPEMRAAWDMVLPYCESVAFSYYPELADTVVYESEGFFGSVQQLAPDKPLLIPEFGIRSDPEQGFSERIQYEFMSKVVSDVAATEPHPVAMIWYPMHDIQYLGAPEWFKEAFATIGLRHYAGTPKLAHAAFRKMLDNTPARSEPRETPQVPVVTVMPNPFHSTCAFRLTESPTTPVRVLIYDMAGRSAGLIEADAGLREIIWSTKGAPHGSYVARVEANGTSHVRRIVLLE